MRVVHTITDLRQALAGATAPAFVPTMGNLHEGHLALVKQARELGGPVVASVFVNRLQFSPSEDFDRYPRTLERDCEQLRAVGCNLVFAPDEAELYPQPQTCKLTPSPALADILEGEFRPRLLHRRVHRGDEVVPVRAAARGGFGRKDYQQLLIVRDMVRQFALPIEIAAADTTRAPDGLALSSRNAYLSEAERAEAPELAATLRALQAALKAGRRDIAALERDAMQSLRRRGWQPDYVVLRRRADLQPATPDGSEPMVALAAARLGRTRLIDSLEV